MLSTAISSEVKRLTGLPGNASDGALLARVRDLCEREADGRREERRDRVRDFMFGVCFDQARARGRVAYLDREVLRSAYHRDPELAVELMETDWGRAQ